MFILLQWARNRPWTDPTETRDIQGPSVHNLKFIRKLSFCPSAKDLTTVWGRFAPVFLANHRIYFGGIFPKKKMSISSKNRWNRKVFFFSNFRIGLFGVDMIGRPVLRKEKLPVLHRSPTLDFCTSFRWSTLTNLSVWPTLSLNVFTEARYWFQRPFKIVLYSSTKLKLKHV